MTGARLSIVLDIPGWTPDQLRQAVHDIDELDSGEGDGIGVQYVTAWDVVQYIATAQLGIVEALPGSAGDANMVIAVNTMEGGTP